MVRILPSDSPLDRMLSYHLADRIQYGAVFHIVMVAFFALGTAAGQKRQVIGAIFMLMMAGTGIARLWAARVRMRYGDQTSVPDWVNRRMLAAYLVHTLVWNLFTAFVLYDCFGDLIAESLIVICVAGTTSSATNALAASRSLCLLYVVTQMTVVITWSIWAQGHFGPVIVIVMIVYLGFQLMVSKSQCEHTLAMFSAQLELKANSEELRKARDAAEEASKARSRFLASMSHEIRTPLNGLLGLAQILRNENESNPSERAEMFDTMVRSGDHLRSIVDDILDYSKLTAGRMVFEQVPVDLERLVKEAAESLAPSAIGKGLRFEITLVPGATTLVTGDPVRLRQIVLNLLSNAIKFTSKGSVELRLEPRATGTIGTRIVVIDSGIGIAPEDQKQLFQDFQQLDASTKRRFGGTGLGLAITKSLVEQMGGTIAIESATGKGSRFIVEIPLPKSSLSSISRANAPAESPKVRVAGSYRILVAEDNPVNQRIAQVMLRDTGATVVLAENGAIAVRLHTAEPFDLIFMDGNMPEMDGFEATANIRKLPGDAGQVPIVALTANALREDRDRCLAAGMTDYLAKPFRREELCAMVERYSTGAATVS